MYADTVSDPAIQRTVARTCSHSAATVSTSRGCEVTHGTRAGTAVRVACFEQMLQGADLVVCTQERTELVEPIDPDPARTEFAPTLGPRMTRYSTRNRGRRALGRHAVSGKPVRPSLHVIEMVKQLASRRCFDRNADRLPRHPGDMVRQVPPQSPTLAQDDDHIVDGGPGLCHEARGDSTTRRPVLGALPPLTLPVRHWRRRLQRRSPPPNGPASAGGTRQWSGTGGGNSPPPNCPQTRRPRRGAR